MPSYKTKRYRSTEEPKPLPWKALAKRLRRKAQTWRASALLAHLRVGNLERRVQDLESDCKLLQALVDLRADK